MSLRVSIIEDEAPAYRRLNGLLQEHHPDLQVVDVLDAIESAVPGSRTTRRPTSSSATSSWPTAFSFNCGGRCPRRAPSSSPPPSTSTCSRPSAPPASITC